MQFCRVEQKSRLWKVFPWNLRTEVTRANKIKDWLSLWEHREDEFCFYYQVFQWDTLKYYLVLLNKCIFFSNRKIEIITKHHYFFPRLGINLISALGWGEEPCFSVLNHHVLKERLHRSPLPISIFSYACTGLGYQWWELVAVMPLR